MHFFFFTFCLCDCVCISDASEHNAGLLGLFFVALRWKVFLYKRNEEVVLRNMCNFTENRE